MYPNYEIDRNYLARTGLYQYIYTSHPTRFSQSHTEKPVLTSTGNKVPKRNPAARPWVSPYGGKRK